MSTLENVDALDALIVGFMSERLRHMGQLESGLFSYYASRVSSGQAFSSIEINVAQWMVENLSHTDVIVDVGCGIGQLAFLLAANGIQCIAVEGEDKRFAALAALHEAVGYWRPTIGLRVRLQKKWLPAEIEGLEGLNSAAFFAGFVAVANIEQMIVPSLKQFSSLIIDPSRFGRKLRNSVEEQAEVLEVLREGGFVNVAPVYDWGGGHFELFQPIEGSGSA